MMSHNIESNVVGYLHNMERAVDVKLPEMHMYEENGYGDVKVTFADESTLNLSRANVLSAASSDSDVPPLQFKNDYEAYQIINNL